MILSHQVNECQPLTDQGEELTYDPDFEFPREKINLVRELGSGAFGEVWLAIAEGILALDAIKGTGEASKRRRKLKHELKFRGMLRGAWREYGNLPCHERILVAVKFLKGKLYSFNITSPGRVIRPPPPPPL